MGLRCEVWLHHLQLATCNLLLVENVELYLAGSQIFAVFAPNDRIYEETTMYYCAGIECPNPLGWYRDKPEDKRFYATCCFESEPLYVKSLDNGLVEVTSMTS